MLRAQNNFCRWCANRAMRTLIAYLVLAATVGFFAARAIRVGQVWEYDFRRLTQPKDMLELAEMGQSGWEVAGTFTHWNGQQSVLLKRKR